MKTYFFLKKLIRANTEYCSSWYPTQRYNDISAHSCLINPVEMDGWGKSKILYFFPVFLWLEGKSQESRCLVCFVHFRAPVFRVVQILKCVKYVKRTSEYLILLMIKLSPKNIKQTALGHTGRVSLAEFRYTRFIICCLSISIINSFILSTSICWTQIRHSIP